MILCVRSQLTQNRTKIFILDSLGNRHPQAMKQLNKWLELEAMDKKKLESVVPAITKLAPVCLFPIILTCKLCLTGYSGASTAQLL